MLVNTPARRQAFTLENGSGSEQEETEKTDRESVWLNRVPVCLSPLGRVSWAIPFSYNFSSLRFLCVQPTRMSGQPGESPVMNKTKVHVVITDVSQSDLAHASSVVNSKTAWGAKGHWTSVLGWRPPVPLGRKVLLRKLTPVAKKPFLVLVESAAVSQTSRNGLVSRARCGWCFAHSRAPWILCFVAFVFRAWVCLPNCAIHESSYLVQKKTGAPHSKGSKILFSSGERAVCNGTL